MRTTPKERDQVIYNLAQLGFTMPEANQLRRISMTLQRWGELECGDGNDYASWAIERDETTGKPYMVTHPHQGKSRRTAIPDREAGAKRRLTAIMANHPHLTAYHQGDPRGAALYILRNEDIRPGESIDSIYNRGVCVY